MSGKRSVGGSPRSLCLAIPPTCANVISVTAPASGPLVWPEAVLPALGLAGPRGPEPFAHCRPWPVQSAVLSHLPLADVGRCPLARCHGLSVGLLFGVLGCRPVSPLSCSPIVQWGGLGLARRQVDRQQHRKGGSRSRRARPYHWRCLLGRSAACTESPLARERVGLGIHRVGRGCPAISPRTRRRWGPSPRRAASASPLSIPGRVPGSVSPNLLLPPASCGVRVARLGPV